MRLTRTTPSTCTLPKQDSMHVPGKIFVSEALEASLDNACIQQVANVASLPGIVGDSIAMPDVHIGYGFPIGGVAAFRTDTGIISPGGIGFDINCGVRLLTTSLSEATVRPLIAEYMELLSRAVPTGTSASSIRLSHEELDQVLIQGSKWARGHGYATDDDVAHTEELGCMSEADPHMVSGKAKDRGVNQLGTLGAGNHFLEIQIVEKIYDTERATVFGLTEGQVVIMIHCGSRGVGHQICSDYLRLMEDTYQEIAATLPEKNLMYAPAASDLGKHYYAAMCAAANFAWCNRQVIAHQVRKATERLFIGSSVRHLYDVSHNIAKRELHTVADTEVELFVHRKGATRSFPPYHPHVSALYQHTGQPVLIPGSMGTASYVLAGAPGAMSESFGSCCHGAGRIMSRTQASETLRGDRVRSDLRDQGIHVRGSAKGIAEEAPQAYKDVDEVIRVVSEAGIAVPVARLKPLGVIKG
jgi:tRNA-splicing ligase RtcB (3'-phosphate/5'-hydroxy nucleic acid ligase)